MAEIFNYAPDEVTVLAGGFFHLDGFVDGTFVSVTKDLVPFSSIRMPDGTTARLYNNSNNYTVRVTLHSASDSNAVLTKMWQLDEITQMGKLPLMIKDHSGSDLLFSPTAWIEGIPDLAKSNGIEGRTWTFRANGCVINIGGNGEASGLLEDLVNIATSALPSLGGIF
ncbi:hypothetical protein D3C81_1596280 [compost metagenome]